MKYSEMVKFLNDNGIEAMQPVIASEVRAQLDVDINENEFEDVCGEVFDTYLGCIEADIWELVSDVLITRGYKSW